MSAYIGIYLSLRSTGLVRFEDGALECATVKSVGSVSDSPGMFVDRIDGVITRILEWVDLRDGDVVTIESPALHGKSSSLDRMFGAWWLVVSAITHSTGSPHECFRLASRKFLTETAMAIVCSSRFSRITTVDFTSNPDMPMACARCSFAAATMSAIGSLMPRLTTR